MDVLKRVFKSGELKNVECAEENAIRVKECSTGRGSDRVSANQVFVNAVGCQCDRNRYRTCKLL